MTQDPRDELAALTADLREWLTWTSDSGASFIEMSAGPRPASAPQGGQPIGASPVPRAAVSPPTGPAREVERPVAADSPSTSGKTGETLKQIRRDLGACERCRLSGARTHIVFGVGPEAADVCVIGEAPGRNEDLTGEPLVGRPGKLFSRMLAAINLSRDKVYLTDVVKCRPAKGASVQPEEIAACTPFLERQVRTVAPKLIITLGEVAARHVTGSQETLSALRQGSHQFRGIPLVLMDRPADLLKDPKLKREAWADLKRVRALLEKS